LKSYKILLTVTFLLALLVFFSYRFIYDSISSDISDYHVNSYENSELSTRITLSTQELKIQLDELTKPLNQLGPINSILVSQHGELVAEQYFGSMHANRGHNIKSASKSILSILTGIAIDKGYLEGYHQTIGEFFPEYFNSNPDSVKASITIEDLLTMRSGLASTSRANYGRWVSSNNWIRYALDRPLQGTPGTDRIYSTGNTHLLAVILHRATGMNTLQFANRYLFGPMDIRVTGWDRDPQGYYLGGNNMAMRPRDLLKIGRLMMDVGVYNGEQLVSRDWIITSVQPVTGRVPGIENYGYLWFSRSAGSYHMVYAFGNGGQYLMILPELDAIIAVTTRNGTSESTRTYRRDLFYTIDSEIIPLLEMGYLGI
jgi:CubicO group peptidase (beta-lactamase class C family)